MVTQNDVSLFAKTNVSYRYFLNFSMVSLLCSFILIFGACEATAIMG